MSFLLIKTGGFMGEWISVEKEMPAANRPVLLFYETEFFKTPTQCVAINFDGKGYFRALNSGFDIPRATHWMPLPDPPSA